MYKEYMFYLYFIITFNQYIHAYTLLQFCACALVYLFAYIYNTLHMSLFTHVDG